MNSIGIIGKGFVGTAVFEGMKHAFDVLCYDKTKGREHWRDDLQGGKQALLFSDVSEDPIIHIVKNVDGPIFVCVPTPMKKDGACDTSIVDSVVHKINDVATTLFKVGHFVHNKPVVCIKSTVVPGTAARLNDECEHIHVCFNPEFLREASYIEDFKNQDRIIIGGPHAGTKILKQMYQIAYPDVPVTKTHSTIAEMVKYVTNCFLSVKVGFANEVDQLCQKLDIDYDKVIEYATKDNRLGNSHWSVPGPDGKKGFGGSCFPKDLNSLMSLACELEIKANTMLGAWNTNLEVRPEQDWKELKGRAVVDEEQND